MATEHRPRPAAAVAATGTGPGTLLLLAAACACLASGCAVRLDLPLAIPGRARPALPDTCIVSPPVMRNEPDYARDLWSVYACGRLGQGAIAADLQRALQNELISQSVFAQVRGAADHGDTSPGASDWVLETELRDLKLAVQPEGYAFILPTSLLALPPVGLPTLPLREGGVIDASCRLVRVSDGGTVASYGGPMELPKELQWGGFWDHGQMTRHYRRLVLALAREAVNGLRTQLLAAAGTRGSVPTAPERGASVAPTALVAVWPLRPGPSIDPAVIEPLTESLRASLINSGRFRVIARDEMERVLAQQQIRPTVACDTTDCAVEYGQALSADKIVVGTVSKIGATHQIVLKLVTVESGQIGRAGQAQGSGPEDVLLQLVRDAASELTR